MTWLWYATRAGGTVALVLLTATVVLGIAAGGRYAPRRIARFEVSALHRNLSVLSLVFLALHITTAIADSFVPMTWTDAFLPFTSAYRSFWVGLGAVALDLLLAVALTSAVRLRLGRRRWKAVHWLAYGAWPVAMLHGYGIGTDSKLGPQLVLYLICAAAVGFAGVLRLRRARPARQRSRSTEGSRA
ncbi:ferric reductase-like transmembrane domain-containing protein [Phaeacidiphilus oryzae]|uniref:ferric reductase-like transmembrane domain-containing protein n=1 Tax=Phaeacidiphilus oryzae TaxID=348818 RepID=UPI00056A0D94|nr:ferric reductase-like transmembrane domain-containing protein [Phaeacidiphilus oryzae]